MAQIAIISASVRTGRKSHRVALYFEKFLQEHQLADTVMLDLKAYNFPVFEERLQYQASPSEKAQDFARKVKEADGIIIVTPEYNGGYPASLKNAIDLLYDERHHKPIAITTVSGGAFGGMQVLTSLQFSLWKMRAWVITAMFPVPYIEKAFDEEGKPTEQESTDKRAAKFIEELLLCMRAEL